MLRSSQWVGALVVIAATATHGRTAYAACGDHALPNQVVAPRALAMCPNEWRVVQNPAHRKDPYGRVVCWFDRHLPSHNASQHQDDTCQASSQDERAELDREAMIAEARRIRRTGDLEGAIEAWLAAHEAFPNEAAIMTSIGYLERERGQMDRSIHWFRRAAATGRDWYNYLRLAVVYTDMGDASGMYWATQELENAAPFKGAGHCMRLLYTKDWQGLQLLAETTLDDGGDPTFWREMAAYGATMVGNVDDALAHFFADYPELFEDPPILKPGRPTSPLWIAWLLQQKGSHEQAEALCNLVLDAIPRKPVREYDWVYNNMFRLVAHALLGDNDEALLELRLGINHGLRMRLFDNVVLFEELPMLRVLHETDEFWRLMAAIYSDNARMRALLQRNTRPCSQPIRVSPGFP